MGTVGLGVSEPSLGGSRGCPVLVSAGAWCWLSAVPPLGEQAAVACHRLGDLVALQCLV